MRLKDKVAIVTGGAQGIGQGSAITLAAEGAQVAVLDLNEEGAKATAKQITAKGGKAVAMKANVLDWDDIHNVVDKVAKDFGKVDILVSCVGGGTFKSFAEYTAEFTDQQIKFNLHSQFYTTHAVVGHMIEKKYGKIILFTTGPGYFGEPGLAGYVGAKAGVTSLGETLSKELAPYQIRVNVIGPGMTDTPLTRDAFSVLGEAGDAMLQKMISRMKFGRIGTPQDIADAVLFFASEESDWITGQHIYVGGM